MSESPWLIAALWVGLALLASLISLRTAISVALVEMLVGGTAGNLIPWFGSFLGTPIKLQTTPWINFLAGFGSILLTFLAGAEIEPDALRKHWKPALAIGSVSFLMPFLAAMAAAFWLPGWSAHASMIAGTALSTTSVAVVYAVMVEARDALGKYMGFSMMRAESGSTASRRKGEKAFSDIGVFIYRGGRWQKLFNNGNPRTDWRQAVDWAKGLLQ